MAIAHHADATSLTGQYLPVATDGYRVGQLSPGCRVSAGSVT